MENTDRTYTTPPIKSEGTEVPVAVTYADATNVSRYLIVYVSIRGVLQ